MPKIRYYLRSRFIFMFLLLMVGKRSSPQSATTYPRITGYVGIMHPIVTFSDGKSTVNFKDYYLGGLPTGINIWKSSKIGFSAEFVPFIRAENGHSKMNNFLFHPGVLVSLGHGFILAGRAAFETSGRYGVTPVINWIFKKGTYSSYYLAIPVPSRFGNDQPASVGIGFQFGITF